MCHILIQGAKLCKNMQNLYLKSESDLILTLIAPSTIHEIGNPLALLLCDVSDPIMACSCTTPQISQ